MDALFADGPGRLAVDALTAVAIFKERVTIMNDRERFEEWAKNSGYALLKTGLNQYFYADTAAAWDAWQEASPHQPNLTTIAQKKLGQMGATGSMNWHANMQKFRQTQGLLRRCERALQAHRLKEQSNDTKLR